MRPLRRRKSTIRGRFACDGGSIVHHPGREYRPSHQERMLAHSLCRGDIRFDLRGNRGRPDRCNRLQQGVHLRGAEQPIWPSRRQVCERRFVESRGFDHAVLGQVVYDQADELE